MNTRTWIFPEHGGTIPGIPGEFSGGVKVVVDEDTNSILSIGPLYPPILPETSALVHFDQAGQEIVTPGYVSKKNAEDADS